MSDLEIATRQLESWIDNRTQVGLIFENGFSMGLNECGTLDRFEGLFIFKNSLADVIFDPRNAVPEVRFEDDVYQVRLRYGCGILSIFERKAAEVQI
jgi:hypothetical protein